MATIVLRSVVNRALTSTEIDANFVNLDTSKIETSNAIFTGPVTFASQSANVASSSQADVSPTLDLDFANSKTLDPRITFDRNSGATYYDGQTTVKAEENLLSYSQNFGAAGWGFQNVILALAANTLSPDLANTGSKLVADTAPTIHLITQQVSAAGASGIVYTMSFYAKAAEYSNVYCTDNQGARYAVLFNLANGTITSNSGAGFISSSISANTNGFYRCSVTANTSTIIFRFALCGTPNAGVTYGGWGADFTGDGTSGIYIWGAQAEQRSTLTGYTLTISAPISNYIPVMMTAPPMVPRFNHDSRPAFYGTCTVSGSSVTLPTAFSDGSSPSTLNNFYTGSSIVVSNTSYAITGYVGSTRVLTVTGSPVAGLFGLVNENYGQSLGLLIEEQRTNLLSYSSDFRNTATVGSTRPWNYNNITVNNISSISPDGTLTANKLIEDNTNNLHYCSGIVVNLGNYSSGVTISCYVKAAERTRILIGAINNTYCIFNLNTKTTTVVNNYGWTAVTPLIIDVGNGWYRCSLYIFTNGSAYNPALAFAVIDNNNNITYQGDGYSGIYLWGAQLEAGSFATSYIPTPSSSTVTRLADNASMTGTNFSNWYNQSEGSLCVEGRTLYITDRNSAPGSFINIVSIDNSSLTNRIILGQSVGTNLALRFVASGTSIFSYTTPISFSKGMIVKGICSYKSGTTIAAFSTGDLTSSSAIFTFSPDRLCIGDSLAASSQNLCGHVRKITYYPKALSAAQLQGLTKL